MFSYNTKISDFNGNVEVKHYKNPIHRMDVSEKEIAADERLKKSHHDSLMIFNPFTGLDEPVLKSEFEADAFSQERVLVSSVNRTRQSIYSICRSNTWEYFVTLTFNPDKIDSTDYDTVVKSLSKYLEYIKSKYSPELKYILVPELHADGKKFHFHGLFSNIGNLKLLDSGIVKNGSVIYNIDSYKKGFSTVSIVRDSLRASGYLLKYITKDLCSVTKNRKRYWCSKNLNKPVVRLDTFDSSDVFALAESFGEIVYTKNVSIESTDYSGYTEVFNHCNIYQINSKE